MAALPCIWEQLLAWYPRWLRPGKHEDHKMGNGKAASLNPPVGTPKKDSSIFIHMGVKTAHYHPRFVGQPSSGQPLSTGHSFSPIYFVEARGSPSHNEFHNADYIIGINQLHLGWVKATLRYSKRPENMAHLRQLLPQNARTPTNEEPLPKLNIKKYCPSWTNGGTWWDCLCTPGTPFTGAQGSWHFCQATCPDSAANRSRIPCDRWPWHPGSEMSHDPIGIHSLRPYHTTLLTYSWWNSSKVCSREIKLRRLTGIAHCPPALHLRSSERLRLRESIAKGRNLNGKKNEKKNTQTCGTPRTSPNSKRLGENWYLHPGVTGIHRVQGQPW